MTGMSSGRRKRRGRKKKQNRGLVCLTLLVWILVVIVCAMNWKKLGEAERTDAYMDEYRKNKREEQQKQKEQDKQKEAASTDDGQNGTAKKGKSEKKSEKKERLLLVNRDHPLPEGYEPDLVWLDGKVGRIAREAYDAATEFINAAKNAGYDLVVASAYRGYEYQKNLVEEDVAALMRRGYSKKDAYEEVYKETMPPGCSEHQTGLAMDLVGKDYEVLHVDMVNTETNQWLRKHCAEYGFVLRYPEDKEDVTKVNYEPWHFRYVGSKKLAKKMMKQGITLEEYLDE